MESLQDKYSPNAVCFGCGPANPVGLHIKSRPEGESLVADWKQDSHHTGYAGYANGGILSMLLDCHGNMTAAYSLMKAKGLESPPGTVTAELTVRFLKPTPIDRTLRLRAKATRIEGRKVSVEGSVEVDGVVTATMQGLYISVGEGHPGFEKWH